MVQLSYGRNGAKNGSTISIANRIGLRMRRTFPSLLSRGFLVSLANMVEAQTKQLVTAIPNGVRPNLSEAKPRAHSIFAIYSSVKTLCDPGISGEYRKTRKKSQTAKAIPAFLRTEAAKCLLKIKQRAAINPTSNPMKTGSPTDVNKKDRIAETMFFALGILFTLLGVFFRANYVVALLFEILAVGVILWGIRKGNYLS